MMHVFKHRRRPLLADNFCPLHLPKWQTSRIPSDSTPGSVTTGFTVPCSKDLSNSTEETSFVKLDRLVFNGWFADVPFFWEAFFLGGGNSLISMI